MLSERWRLGIWLLLIGGWMRLVLLLLLVGCLGLWYGHVSTCMVCLD